jgi:hypothetical protein
VSTLSLSWFILQLTKPLLGDGLRGSFLDSSLRLQAPRSWGHLNLIISLTTNLAMGLWREIQWISYGREGIESEESWRVP